MLDQLVESKDTFTGLKLLLGLVVLVSVIAATAAVGSWIWGLYSLYSSADMLMSGDLALSSLVAPPPPPEEPPPVQDEPKKEQPKNLPNVDTRTEVIQRIDEVPRDVPDKPSAEKVTIPPRDPNKLTVQGKTNQSFDNSVDSSYRGPVSSNPSTDNKCVGVGCASATPKPQTKDDDDDELAIKTPTPKPTEKPRPQTVSGGVVNGKARSLVTPQYPASARAVRASGQVSVAVTIDENGNVISASAVSGHPLLRPAAESAARSSKFNPTLLSGQPVKVTGTIIYNFVAP